MTKFSSNKIVITDWSQNHTCFIYTYKWLKEYAEARFLFPISNQPLWYTEKTLSIISNNRNTGWLKEEDVKTANYKE